MGGAAAELSQMLSHSIATSAGTARKFFTNRMAEAPLHMLKQFLK